ncbi:MAG TPA: oxygenase MpaB family protein, partial [Streptosporangiaceae bacterium]|nr:oxygenase MpaB family protein [Streptosporangiaceae bacterium]
MTDRPGQADPRDSGLFGPGSVTWRVLSEPVMWIAGLRAMYLQALHPRVMLGTWQNTAFAKPDEAWGRFTRTVEFVRVRTYGSTAEVERLGARLRKVHASLRGVDDDGQEFRLDEPELLLWVHCGEIGSYAEIARRSGVHVTPAELDAFVDEQRRSAAVVGLDPALAPASMAELDEYYEQMRPRLRASAEARHALRLSFTPRLPPALTPLRLIVPPLNVLGYASMPRWARRMYGTPAIGLTDAAITL